MTMTGNNNNKSIGYNKNKSNFKKNYFFQTFSNIKSKNQITMGDSDYDDRDNNNSEILKKNVERLFLENIQWKICLFYFFTCTYIMVMFQLSIEFKKPSEEILYDSLFHLFKEIPDSEGIIEMLVNGTLLYTMIRIYTLEKKKGHLVLCHALTTAGTCYLLRGIVLSSTLLPNPFPNCDSMLDPKQPLMLNGLLVFLKIKRTCNDVMFSGHSMSLALFSAISWQYFKKTEAIFVTLFASFAAFFIISARFHYTSDVIVGASISLLVFYLIESRYIIACNELKYQKKQSIILKYFLPIAHDLNLSMV
jgi:membrane-associated phospholipid phosphatase